MTNRDETDYIRSLHSTAAALLLQAAEARRRELYGLTEAFTEAAVSIARWAASLAEDATIAAIEEAERNVE